MDATATQLTDIKFNEAKRGYDPVEVDNFLEKLGDAVVKLQDKVREANRRADDAERRVADAQRAASTAEKRALDAEAKVAMGGGSADEDELAETLKKTLLLAQRTADETVKEATAEAASLVAGAEQKAARLVEDANRAAAKRLAVVEDEITARRSAETRELEEQVNRLEDVRVLLVADIEALEGHLAEVRTRMRAGADLLIEVLDDAGRLQAPSRPTLRAAPVETVIGGAATGRPSSAPGGPATVTPGDKASADKGGADKGGADKGAADKGADPSDAAAVQPAAPVEADAAEADTSKAGPEKAGAPDETPEKAGTMAAAAPPPSSSSPGAQSGASGTAAPPSAGAAPTIPERAVPSAPPRTGAPLPGRGSGTPAGSPKTGPSAVPPPPASDPSSAEASARLFPADDEADAPDLTPATPSSASTPASASDTGPPTQPVAVVERGPAARDDGFLDELRKAADDDPLGPMDADADAAMQAFFTEDEDDLPKRPRFGRRR